MSTTVDGIVSGLDTTALIAGIVDVAAVPKEALEDQLAQLEEAQEATAGIESRLSDLSDAIDAIDSLDELSSFTTTTSEDGYIAVTAEGEANPGSYDIEVVALAAAEIEVSQGYADETTDGVMGTGDLNITIAGTVETITLDGTEDLSDVAELIDELDGVSAFVLDTGEATDPYKLVIQAEDTGADNTIEVDGSALTGTAPTMTEMVAAADAEITVAGVTIYNDTNNFNDVLPGISVEAKQVTSSPITVTVEVDETAMTEKVQAFVDAFNEVISYYDSQTVFDTELGLEGGLVGDSTTKGIIEKLQDMMTDRPSGELDGADFQIFADLGITMGQDGELDFDTSVFSDALNEDFEAATKLFTSDDSPLNATSGMKYYIDDFYIDDDGLLSERSDTIEDEIEEMEERISDYETRLENLEARLRDQFTAMELALAEMESAAGYLSALFTTDES